MNQVERYKKIVDDKQVQEAAKAAARTAINAGIVIADFVPAAGDAVSWTADVMKFSKYDLTPDVSKKIAIGSEVLEAFSAGMAPSHAIEGVLQLRKDLPRMREGFAKLKEIWTEEQDDYANNREDIDAAVTIFDVEPTIRSSPA